MSQVEIDVIDVSATIRYTTYRIATGSHEQGAASAEFQALMESRLQCMACRARCSSAKQRRAWY